MVLEPHPSGSLAANHCNLQLAFSKIFNTRKCTVEFLTGGLTVGKTKTHLYLKLFRVFVMQTLSQHVFHWCHLKCCCLVALQLMYLVKVKKLLHCLAQL